MNPTITQTDFFQHMFLEFHTDKDPSLKHYYRNIITHRKNIHELFIPELTQPEYEGTWARLLSQYFSQNQMTDKDIPLCEWAVPLLMKKYLENFKPLSTYQKDNEFFRKIYKEAKKNVGETMSAEELTQNIQKISKLKDLEIIIKALENNPSLAVAQTQNAALNARYFQNWDASHKIAKVLEKLNVPTNQVLSYFFPEKKAYQLHANFSKMSFYWAQKIFGGTDITQDQKENLVKTFFEDSNNRYGYGYDQKKPPTDKFFSRFYSFVEAYKTEPRSLVVILPYIIKYFEANPSLKTLHNSFKAPSDNPFLWMLNFLQQFQEAIDKSRGSPQATAKLQKTLIKLEEKNLLKEIKKVKPVAAAPVKKSSFKI